MGTIPTNADFTNGPLRDLAKSVTRIPVTVRTDNDTGDQIKTYGDSESISAVISNVRTKYEFQFEGQVRQADAKLFVFPTVTVNKYDKIVKGSKTYMVFSEDDRDFGVNTLFKSYILFEI